MIEQLRAALGDAYVIERELGGGGMSRVFLAEERALGRRVVIKTLPPEIAAAINADRFRREIQLAASLQHPHIVPVLASGDGGGLLWYSMPHIEGQSLRALIEREGSLPPATGVRLLRDIADALEHAHNKGVVHRDIKPENILLSGNHAMVTDFGIAKALATARQDEAAATVEGLVIGTPAYMAPEQAAGDRQVDQRADVYALGAVGYEMLAGVPVFTRPTPQAMIAAHIAETPAPLEKVKSSVPAQLSQLVMLCLAKDPARRPTAFAVRTTLESQGPSAVTSRRRRVVLTVAAAIALLFITSAATGFWPRRSLVARGLFEGHDRILVADVENRTSDSTLGLALTQALRVDLSQSDIMRVVSDQEIRSALRRMQREPGTRLTDSVSRELAVREGIPAVVSAEISRVGTEYLLSARILAPADGRELAAVRQTAGNDGELLEALGKLSRELRRRTGESLRSIAGTAPLERVSTGSLEALRKYSLGVQAFDIDRDFDRSRALFSEAIAQDSGFAMAWRKLGIQLSNEGKRAEAVAALTAAYRHRERLTGTERSWLEASYFGTVTFEDNRAIQAYRTIIEADSLDYGALNNLALILVRIGRLAEADSILVRSTGIDSSRASPLTNRVEVLIALNQLDRADSLLAVIKRRFRYDVAIGVIELELRYRQEGVAGAERTLPLILATGPDDPGTRQLVAEIRGNMAALRGSVREAFRHYQTARREALLAEEMENYFDDVFSQALVQNLILGEPQEAVAFMERELREHPFDGMDQLDRPYLEFAYNYALARQFNRARAMLAEFERIPRDLRRREDAFRLSVNAMIALGEGDFDQAMDFMDRNTRKDDCPSCVRAERGLIWDRSANADSAIAEYEGFLSQPDISRPWTDQYYLPNILYRLGQLYEQKGDKEKALDYYGRFAELWKDADRELQPKVTEARNRMAALTAE